MRGKPCMSLNAPRLLEVANLSSRYKSWRTTIFLPWAAALMIAGFATREYGAHHTDNLGILIASVVLIMSGP
jgi:hypothetical protein